MNHNTGNEKNMSNTSKPLRKNKKLIITVTFLSVTVACYLQWLWLVVPPEAGSPALSVMSQWGFFFCAGLTILGISFVGLHCLLKSDG